MAQFELIVYGILNGYIEDFELNESKTGTITDEEFIQLAEDKGLVRTLCSLLTEGGLFETRISTYRAYLIDVDNAEAKPIRADLYRTYITSNKVIAHRTDYEDGCKDKPYVVYEE